MHCALLLLEESYESLMRRYKIGRGIWSIEQRFSKKNTKYKLVAVYRFCSIATQHFKAKKFV